MMYFEYQFKRELTYYEVMDNFFRDLTDTFQGFILSKGRIRGYPEHLLNVFITFDLMVEYELDYELVFSQSRQFRKLSRLYRGWSEEEWMQIYRLFGQTIKFKHRLSPFIRLFFYDLVYIGPFGEDIEALDMSDELLDLMGEEMKKLNNLFDRYLISDDSRFIREMVNISKSDSIPEFVVVHLADRINEHVGDDKKDLRDSICELYMIAIEKILKKPELTGNDKSEISSIFFTVDTSNFTDTQKDHVYSVISGYNVNEYKKSLKKRRRLPPRYRC